MSFQILEGSGWEKNTCFNSACEGIMYQMSLSHSLRERKIPYIQKTKGFQISNVSNQKSSNCSIVVLISSVISVWLNVYSFNPDFLWVLESLPDNSGCRVSDNSKKFATLLVRFASFAQWRGFPTHWRFWKVYPKQETHVVIDFCVIVKALTALWQEKASVHPENIHTTRTYR